MLDLLGKLHRHWRRDTGVSLGWLARSSSRLDRRFAESAVIQRTEAADGLDVVTINGTRFIWPHHSPLKGLVMTAAELMLTEHPHQYLWGGTMIKQDDVVIDVGCCEGSFAAKAAEMGGRVVVVEPSKVMLGVIEKLFMLRGLGQPIYAPMALGASGETLIDFTDNITNPGASRIGQSADAEADKTANTYPVRLTTLDAMVDELKLTRLDFIKCDAEGYDLDVLRGAMKTVARFRPKLALCTYHKHDHFAEMKKLLGGLGYTIRGKGLFNTAGEFNVLMLHAWRD
jgi:FkbM family methyltransferase